MTKPITWEIVLTKSTVSFGVLHRCKLKGGWLLTNKSSSSSSSSKLSVFVPDENHLWTTPELSWENVVNDGVAHGTTVRARALDGWLIGHKLGTTISSRTLDYLSDKDSSWLSDDLPPPPPPEPEPIPEPTPVSTKWLGTNFMNIADYIPDYPFLNFFFKARPWISSTSTTWDDGRTILVDQRKNVLSLEPGQIARSVLFTAKRPAVNFILSWTGTGVVSVSGASIISKTSNTIVFKPNETGNVWMDLASTDPANPAKDFKIFREDQQSVIGLFEPTFLNDIKKYSCLRFMGWQETNTTRTQESLEKDFVPLNSMPITLSTTKSDSVPLELMIEACNQTNVNGWFCINFEASDSYVDKFLALVKTKLNPGLKIYLESGNEYWNSIFPAYKRIPGTTHDEKMKFVALKAADLHTKAKLVLGDRCITVLGAHSANSWWQENLIKLILASGKQLPNVLSTAPYFGHSLVDNITVFDDGSLNTAVTKAIQEVVASKLTCDKYGMKLTCYEGGSHILPGINVNRDPRIKEVYKHYLREIKKAAPNIQFCHFTYVSHYSQHGSWGEREYMYDVTSPKFEAVDEIIKEQIV